MMPDRDGDAEDANAKAERVKRLSDERRKLFDAVSGNGDLLRKIRAERTRGSAGAADSVEAAGFGPPTPEAASRPVSAPAEPARAGPQAARAPGGPAPWA